MFADSGQTEAHVAAVGKKGRSDSLLAAGAVVGGYNRLRLLHSETGSFDIIRQHCSGGSHYTRILHEKALGDFQIMRVEIEIIIDEEQNVVVAGQGEDCVSLPGEP